MFALLMVLARYGVYQAFFDTNRLPKGDLIAEIESLHGTYTIKAYVINVEATIDYAVQGELVFHREN
ncbi:DUF5412 family protein [Caldibacillus debilis]|jgi:hypothetical protein|uniref:DUF5412 family protein n=1 Tax=Caldibacillus debilis TaxID=301148 RepID=UPI000B55B93B|nr:DUF5412 family protein [Caldibacillus debilis]OUM91799.1 MAG: hypothetical protein BAA03_05805 [Caldibacillus debilis]